MEQFIGSRGYVASEELLRSVNIAMALEKPLLVKGEPGTGKTMLAQAVAENLGMELLVWSIKSTTKAQDGLYVYDTVQRLYDSQFGADVSDIGKYIKLGKLGESFRRETPCVLLIDEIDKAGIEFPTTCSGSWTRWSSISPRPRRPSKPSTVPSSSSPPTPKKSCRTPFCAAVSSTISAFPSRT